MTTTRRLAAILAADIAGYSRLMGDDEEGTLAALRTLRHEVIDPTIAGHRGRIVKTTGDGVLAEFQSVVDAVRCATAWQATMPADSKLTWRIGVHQGDIVAEDDDIFGDGVNVAARLEAIAEPGGICVSARVQEDAAGKLDINFEDLGEQSLKNIARPVRVFRVRADRPAKSTAAADPAALPLPEKPSIAVLPFQNLSGDAEQEYFADGVVEEIITALSRIRWLFVIARNSSFTYKGRAIDVKQVGRELGVRYVLEGSVRKGGNRVRITAQLIDAEIGAHLWADRFDGALDDIFELQDQVASSVAGAIEPKLRQSEFERAGRKPTESLDAYNLYLRALALRDTHTDESMHEAIELLKRALAIDPGYAPAKALFGWSLIHQGSHGRAPIAEDQRVEAVTLAREALAAAKDDPDTLSMAAFTMFFLAGERDVSAAAADRAVSLNPNSAYAWMVFGRVCIGQGEPARAIEACERALRLSPFDHLRRAFTTGIAMAHLLAGRYEEALDWSVRTLREEPGYRGALHVKAVACACLGRTKEAEEAVRQMLEAQPWITVQRFKTVWARFFPPDIAAGFAEALRAAGLPEK